MKINIRLLVAFTCAFFLSSLSVHAEVPWGKDASEACRQAKEQHKDLMILYKGSDWGANASRDISRMLNYDQLMLPLKDKFIFLELPSPQFSDGTTMTLLVLADAENRPYFSIRTAILDNGPDCFKEELAYAETLRDKFEARFKKLEGLQGEERFRQMGEIIQSQELGTILMCKPYTDWAKELMAQDKADISGYAKYRKMKDGEFAQWQQCLITLNTEASRVYEAGMSSAEEAAQIKKVYRSLIDNPDLTPKIRSLICFSSIMSLGVSETIDTKSPQVVEKRLNALIQEMKKIDPGSQEAFLVEKLLPGLVWFNYAAEQGKNLMDTGRYDEALLVVNTAEQNAGSSIQAAINFKKMRGKILMMKGDIDAGLAMMKESVDLFPYSTQADDTNYFINRVQENKDLILELLKEHHQGNNSRFEELQEIMAFDVKMAFDI